MCKCNGHPCHTPITSPHLTSLETLILCVYKNASSSVTSAKAMTTGLNATSHPRMLKSQATSSSAEITIPWDPLARIRSLSARSLSATAWPAKVMCWIAIAPVGGWGRLAQVTSTRLFVTKTREMLRGSRALLSLLAVSIEMQEPSTPTREPEGKLCERRPSVSDHYFWSRETCCTCGTPTLCRKKQASMEESRNSFFHH